ncbi:MAG: hypothetical protein Q9222_004195 [Ikaeria aurantiellina]
MSPPPRHEAEDYLSSQGSHGGKKKHRGAISPLLVNSGPSRPLVTEKANKSAFLGGSLTVDKQHKGDTTRILSNKALPAAGLQPHGHRLLPSQALGGELVIPEQSAEGEQPSATGPETIRESPAVISLRRMSEAKEDIPASASSSSNNASRTVREAPESLFSTSNGECQSRKQSIDDFETPVSRQRRRSAAFRDGDRRRPKKNEGTAAIIGLEIPATITLRKATGLFHSVPTSLTASASLSQAAAEPQDEPVSLLNSPTLIKFDSRVWKDRHGSTSSQSHIRIRKPSGATAAGQELQACIPVLNGSRIIESRRPSLAEPAVTISREFPSPAVLVSPTKTPLPDDDFERRVSVVQIVSRKSLHQVIWHEGDASSSSESSEDPISPTGSESDRNKEVEMTPFDLLKDSDSKNEAGTPRSSSTTSKEQKPLLADTVTQEAANPKPILKARPEGQMLRWTWGTPADNLEDPTVAADSVPQLFVPAGNDGQPMNPESRLARRGSFVANGSAYLSLDFGRELGSRRSISVHPLSLPEGENEGAPLLESGGYVSRRVSCVE